MTHLFARRTSRAWLLAVSGCLVAAVAFLTCAQPACSQTPPAGTVAEPVASDQASSDRAASDPTAVPENPLASGQSQLAIRFKKLEGVLLRSAEIEAGTNPARAALMQQAAAMAKQVQLSDALVRAARSLEQKQFSQAIEDQKASLENLNKILELLQSENRTDRVREQRDQIRRTIEETERLLRLESSLRGRTEGGSQLEKAASDQQKLAEKAAQIAQDLSPDSKDAPDQDASDKPDSSNKSSQSKSPADDKSKDPKKGDQGDKSDAEKKADADKKAGGESADKPAANDKQSGDKNNKPDKDASGDKKSADDPANKPSEGPNKTDPNKAQPKDGKDPAAKDPASKDPDGKDSDGKDSDGKGSDKQDGNKSKDGQPSQGSPGDKKSKPSEDSPSEQPAGEQQPSGGEQSSEQESSDAKQSQSQPKNPAERAAERLKQARKRMQEAQKNLAEEDRNGAVEKQRQAEQELKTAIEELEEILRQLREEEIERSLTALEERLRLMLQLQNKVLDESKRLQEIGAGGNDRQVEIRANSLAADEKKILNEAQRALLLLREEGTSAAFPESLSHIIGDMQKVVERLTKADLGKLTIGIEEDIVSSLEELVAAMSEIKKENKDRKENQMQAPGQQGGQPGEQPLVNQLAEMRLIKTLQIRINKRTQNLSEALKDPSDVVGQAEAVDIQNQLRELAERQSSVKQVMRDIVSGKNQQ